MSLKPSVGLSMSTSRENSGMGAESGCGIVTAIDALALLGDGNLGMMKFPEDRFDCRELFLETDILVSEGCDARPPAC